MKLLSLFLFATYLVAQATINITVPGETVVQAAFSADAIASVAATIAATTICKYNADWVLSATATAGDTTFSITSTSGQVVTTLAQQGCIAIGEGILIEGELSLVTSVSPLVVTRGQIGTAKSHAAGTVVLITQWGNYAQWLKYTWIKAAIESQQSHPGPTLAAALAAQAVATASAKVPDNGGVQ